jgi:hypothetical protein
LDVVFVESAVQTPAFPQTYVNYIIVLVSSSSDLLSFLDKRLVRVLASDQLVGFFDIKRESQNTKFSGE